MAPAAGNVGLKKAVNNAIDRIAMINQRGAYAGVINDQYMPPSMRGFQNAAIYPARPNVARARSLAQGNTARRQGRLLHLQHGPVHPDRPQIVQDNLKAIGLDMEIKPFPRAVQFTKSGTRGEPFDMSLEGWHMDYFDPYDFMFLLDGTTIRPANNSQLLVLQLDAQYNRKIAAAASPRRPGPLPRVRQPRHGPREECCSAGDVHQRQPAVTSSRSRRGCYFYQPVYELDIASICKK